MLRPWQRGCYHARAVDADDDDDVGRSPARHLFASSTDNWVSAKNDFIMRLSRYCFAYFASAVPRVHVLCTRMPVYHQHQQHRRWRRGILLLIVAILMIRMIKYSSVSQEFPTGGDDDCNAGGDGHGKI